MENETIPGMDETFLEIQIVCFERLHQMGIEGLFSPESRRYWNAIDKLIDQTDDGKLAELLVDSEAFNEWWEHLNL